MISKSSKRKKILYVCPLAHHGGHRPTWALAETEALTRSGLRITLLTFDGLPGGKIPSGIPHITILSQNRFSALLRYFSGIFNRWTPLHLIVMFFETFSTLVKAIFLKKQEKYDIIHLRDGDPFLFLLLLLNFFTKDCKWVVFVFMDPNSGVLQKINYAKIWLPIYRRSLSRNRLLFLCENDLIKQELEKIMPDLFAKKVIHLPLPANYVGSTLPKAEARQHLMLPKNKAILLSFGSHHSGKNPEVVVRASRDLPDVYLLLAGKIPPNVTNRVKSIKNHLIIKNYYIPEKEKQLYFCASDAIVLSYNKTFLKRNPAAMLWDACKFGIPIIASDGGQLGKLVRLFQLGLLFEPENELSLRKAILCFLSLEPKKLKTLKKNCERFCTEFSTQKWSEQIKRIYDYLLKEPFNELPF